MQRDIALMVFSELEKTRSADDNPTSETKPPTFDVRLDAVSEERQSDGVIARGFRIRVASSRFWGPADPDQWRYVLELVEEHGLSMDFQNNAIEVT